MLELALWKLEGSDAPNAKSAAAVLRALVESGQVYCEEPTSGSNAEVLPNKLVGGAQKIVPVLQSPLEPTFDPLCAPLIIRINPRLKEEGVAACIQLAGILVHESIHLWQHVQPDGRGCPGFQDLTDAEFDAYAGETEFLAGYLGEVPMSERGTRQAIVEMIGSTTTKAMEYAR